ncbi:DUF721 domain-containing protein [Lysobacter sp. SG-8]|uniref:DUF721 domain-containing protein n=2 Tax=Marilutibacter penaei TaxID=2759900 RepID=A0A7W3U474_9GAMM|nr:DUF721 domain-containing protein [Lysobacter penaei]MBB1088599.1 DUF721 domain-containing protein [Lysobacter penaei]
MSDSKAKSRSARQSAPQEALDALLAEPSGDPIRRAIWLGEVDRRLHPHLPPSLAEHARLANIKGSTLVFVVDAPVWSAKLRLAAPDLLDVARSIGLVATDVAIKVSTDARLPPVTPPRRPIPLSPRSEQALRSALDSLRDDEASRD